MRVPTIILGFIIALLVPGCSTTPPLSEATGISNSGVYVGEVVNRVKCELAIAFARKLNNDPEHQYMWLLDWTVKADLTLQINEQGGISPSGSYTTFRKSAINQAAGPTSFPGTTLGTVQQFFTLGANVNLGEQAVRTEVVSFTVAIKELDDLRKRTPESQFEEFCKVKGQPELLGNLGLGEWIDAALAPVVDHTLLAGKHPAPSIGAKPAQPSIVSKPASIAGTGPGAAVAKRPPTVDEQVKLDEAEHQAAQAEATTESNFNTNRSLWVQVETNLNAAKRLRTTYDNISTSETTTNLRRQESNFDKYWEVAKDIRNCTLRQLCGDTFGDCKRFDGSEAGNSNICQAQECVDPQNPAKSSGVKQLRSCVRDALEEAKTDAVVWVPIARDAARRAQIYANNAKDLVDYGQKLAGITAPIPPDPPIDSIGHSVQFVLAYGGGVTPSWTLISWKGPGLNGPMAAASANRTQLLQLALGSSANAGKSTQEQNRIIQNQTIFLSRP